MIMKVIAESTPHILTLDGVDCRVWDAVTDDGRPCLLLVHRLAIDHRLDALAPLGGELELMGNPHTIEMDLSPEG